MKKVIRFICGLMLVGGFIFLLGTVGSNDINQITYEQFCIQSNIAIVVILVGFFGLKLSGWEHIG